MALRIYGDNLNGATCDDLTKRDKSRYEIIWHYWICFNLRTSRYQGITCYDMWWHNFPWRGLTCHRKLNVLPVRGGIQLVSLLIHMAVVCAATRLVKIFCSNGILPYQIQQRLPTSSLLRTKPACLRLSGNWAHRHALTYHSSVFLFMFSPQNHFPYIPTLTFAQSQQHCWR